MDGAEKVKIALDESRMLVLGAQVLLGFQLRSAFQDRFDELPQHAKTLDALSLVLMTCVIALLVAPAIHHRVVEDGNATTRSLHGTSTIMAIALLPFAVSLGINVFVALESVAGTGWALVAGLAGTSLALWFWFGVEWIAIAHGRGKPMQHVDEEVPLSKKIDQMLTEARVVLPGAQALFGFQLAVMLTEAFERLPFSSKAAHAVALGFVVLSTMLLMTPAAYHRMVYGGEESQQFHELGGTFIMAATLFLAFGLATDVYVVIARIAQSELVGLLTGGGTLLLLVGLWHVSPLVLRRAAGRRS